MTGAQTHHNRSQLIGLPRLLHAAVVRPFWAVIPRWRGSSGSKVEQIIKGEWRLFSPVFCACGALEQKKSSPRMCGRGCGCESIIYLHSIPPFHLIKGYVVVFLFIFSKAYQELLSGAFHSIGQDRAWNKLARWIEKSSGDLKTSTVE